MCSLFHESPYQLNGNIFGSRLNICDPRRKLIISSFTSSPAAKIIPASQRAKQTVFAPFMDFQCRRGVCRSIGELENLRQGDHDIEKTVKICSWSCSSNRKEPDSS